jgi:hypothetical protein
MARSEETPDEIKKIADAFAEVIGAPKKVTRPPGTITAREYAEAHKVKQKTASEFLYRIYRQGKAERFKIGNTYCYRLK